MKADRLREGDQLALSDKRTVEVVRVQLGVRYVRITFRNIEAGPHSRSFSVPNSCRFQRVFVDATINTRPDLVSVK